MTGSECNAPRMRRSGAIDSEISKKDINERHVQNVECSVEPTLMERDAMEDKIRQLRTEALRMKILEVLGNVSSPKEQHPRCELNIDENKVGKFSPIPMLNLNSDTIESDSEEQARSRRPVTRSLRKKKPPAVVVDRKIASSKSTWLRKGPPQSSLLLPSEVRYGRLNGKTNLASLSSKRKKVANKTSQMAVDERPARNVLLAGHQCETKSRSPPDAEKFVTNQDEVPIIKSSEDRVKDRLNGCKTDLASLSLKRKKVASKTSEMNVDERQARKILLAGRQSETNSRSPPDVEKFVTNQDEVSIIKSSEDRAKDGLNGKTNLPSLSSIRKKVANKTSVMDVDESPAHKILLAEHQSQTKSRSPPDVEKFVTNKDEVLIIKSSEDRVKDRLPESVIEIEKHNSYVSTLKASSPKDLYPNPVSDVERRYCYGSPVNGIYELEKKNQLPHDVGISKCQEGHLEDGESSMFIKTIGRINNASVGATTSKQKTILYEDDELGSIKDHQKGTSISFSKNRRAYFDDCSVPDSGIKLPGFLTHRKQENLMEKSSGDKIFNSTRIRSFRSLCSSKFNGRKRKEIDSSSDGTDEINRHLQMEPGFVMEDGGKNQTPSSATSATDSQNTGEPGSVMEDDGKKQTPSSATNATDSENSGDEYPVTGCRESVEVSPMVCGNETFQHDSHENSDSEKHDKVTRSLPLTEDMSTGSHEFASVFGWDGNRNDGLDSAVALLITALDRVKTKLNSATNKRCASILQASAAAIHSSLQNAESQVMEDASKLINLSHSKRKLLETKFQEKQEHMLGIYKRFKEEIAQQLQDYGGLVDDLEGNKTELKRNIERQRAAQKKIMLRAAEEINGQVQDAEAKITAVQKSAAEKMVRLKLVVEESIKHVATC
ncbi:hypothetical protein M569_12458 [Genlisea aurea]|uniref:Meiosis-specific protein ASY3-like coiled-coil domain-containing protein n=1 Tax=Genlisea aurea TaxID=192259 RepID=S8DI01_9LAMI|nr:hypothetical protein M569_12458 [Genlisea aurea]